MATNEWIDIADTVVKIGLGALISGVATYYVTKLKINTDVSKEQKLIHRNLMLEAVNSADEYFHFISNYYSRLDGIRLAASPIDELDDDSWDSIRASISEVESDLAKSRSCIQSAITKVTLLGLDDIVETLEGVSSCETKLRKFFMGNSLEIPDEEYLQEWAKEYIVHKNKFHKLMSKAFLEKC